MIVRSILVGMDFSECALNALSYAGLLSRYFGADLHILNVTPSAKSEQPADKFPFSQGDLSKRFGEDAGSDRQIQIVVSRGNQEKSNPDMQSQLPSQSILRVTQSQRSNASPAEGILEYADVHGIDLIVLGTHGRSGLDRILLGSVAEEVARRSPRPVLTIRNKDDSRAHLPVRRILLPVDFSPISTSILIRAGEIARHTGATLDLFHVIEDVRIPEVYGVAPVTLAVPEVFSRSKVALRKLFETHVDGEIPFEVHVTSGKPHERILNFASTQGTDLIVIGTDIHTDSSRFLLGRVGERVIRLAPCPVVSMRNAEAP